MELYLSIKYVFIDEKNTFLSVFAGFNNEF